MGITIVKREPKVGIAGYLCVVINQASQYAFPLFLPLYLQDQGISITVWFKYWGTIFISNIAFNLILVLLVVTVWLEKYSYLVWAKAVGCGVFTLMLFYTPQLFSGNVF